jgi:carboxylesterase type B
LRTVSYETLLKATTSVPGIFDYQSLALSYLPRPDGKALTKSPEFLAQSGTYAPVPFIGGDQEDEGTLFSLSQSNISTTQQIFDYLGAYVFHDAMEEQLQQLVATYPDDPAAGSPFRTGPLNNI